MIEVTMMRHSHDFIFFVLLNIVKDCILCCKIDIVVIVLSICFREVNQSCLYFWVASIIVKDVITDRNILVFCIVAFASGQCLLHAVRVDRKHIFLVRRALLNNIIK